MGLRVCVEKLKGQSRLVSTDLNQEHSVLVGERVRFGDARVCISWLSHTSTSLEEL